MKDLERHLKSALARKSPPAQFADRVLAAAGREVQRSGRPRGIGRALSRVAAALLVATIGTGAWMQHQESVRQQREAERASVLVKLALHIASEKTNIARDRLRGDGRDDTKRTKEGTSHETKND